MISKENGFVLPINLNFPDAKKYTFTFISLLIILMAVYSNSFHGEWHFDDFANIVNNPYVQIKSFSWPEIKHCIYGLTQERPSRPLSYLSFALNYYFDGENVFGYHVVNFIIHYLAAVFLFLFIYNTLKLPLTSRKIFHDCLSGCAAFNFFLGSKSCVTLLPLLILYNAWLPWRHYFTSCPCIFILKARTDTKLIYSIIFFIFSALCGLAAVLTKENAAMLPVSYISL